jgi:uncharacterized protein (TIGR00290 family)
MPEKVVVSWSGGKDSTMALAAVRADRRYEVVSLLATVTAEYDRVSLHGVRRDLLERQAAALGLPLRLVFVSAHGANEEYEAKMREALADFQAAGVGAVVFGDLYLEDVRRYRELKLLTVGLKGIFPLWGQDTAELAQGFITRGFKAVVTCVDTQVLKKAMVGRKFTRQFLSHLPAGVDPCGENGEFHSFVYDGPFFQQPVRFTRGDRLLAHDRFYFCDLLPKD